MDGFTQGVIGAAAAQAAYGRRLGRWSLAIGFGAGLLPDADFALRLASGSVQAWVMHRTFTHSLFVIPLGGLIAALPFLLSPALRRRWREVYVAATLGFATHAPLDMATTFGTVALWPFSDLRISADIIAIVDPAFTLILLAGVVWSALRRSPRPARIALCCAAAYMGFAALQHHRAASVQARIIDARGDVAEIARVMPSLINVIVYRSVYLDAEGTIHVDAIRVPVFGAPTMRVGGSLPVFRPEAEGLIERARSPERLQRDLARYVWFAQGLWARAPGEPGKVGDMRFSGRTAGLRPIWGIDIDPGARVPVRLFTRRKERLALGALAREVLGLDPRYVPIPGPLNAAR